MKQLLKNARVYDGTGAEPYQADLLLDGDRIAKIAGEISCPADSITDLKGMSVSPGYIDGHSHNDWFAIKKDPLPYFRPFVLQGITTFIAGNCGISEIGFEKGNPYYTTNTEGDKGIVYEYKNGRIVREIYPNGNIVCYQYDKNDRSYDKRTEQTRCHSGQAVDKDLVQDLLGPGFFLFLRLFLLNRLT